jgi:hypothetical protein
MISLLCRNNANAALVFELCYRFNSIAKSYFGKLDEESVKNNFVLIYELIDGKPSIPVPLIRPGVIHPPTLKRIEIIDFGFPQNSEIDALRMYITTESVKSELAVVSPPRSFDRRVLLALTVYPTRRGKTLPRSHLKRLETCPGEERVSSTRKTRSLLM